MNQIEVKKAEGKLGVLVVGLGAVSSTFMTGVLMTRKGLAKPVGSMTQYDVMRVGEGADKKYLKYNQIVPMKAAFDHNYAKRLDGDNVKDCKTRWDMVQELKKDIRDFKEANGCARVVVLWAASTEV